MFKKLIVAIGVIAATALQSTGQVCPSNSRVPYEWPGHNNWFISPNLYSGSVINMSTMAVTSVGDAWSPVSSYEGVSAASDDNGNLLMYTNGRKMWTGTGAGVTNTYSGLLEGNESGIANGSASQGIITVKHPLNPDVYHVFTTDDALAATKGLNHFTFDENGNHLSGPTRLGSFRTSEGISATFHENGVDIWVTVLGSGTSQFNSFLIKCTGVDATPVTSAGPDVSGNRERGGVAFSWDGEYFASAHPNFWPDNDKIVSIYKFDRATGQMTQPKNVSVAGWGSPYDVIFSPDNQRVYVSLQSGQIKYVDISSWNEATITSTWASTGLSVGFSSMEIGPDGSMYVSHGVAGGGYLKKVNGNLNSGTSFSFSNVSGTAGQSHLGLPNMFIPPAEEPDIQEVGPYCDTASAVDLSTTWICAGTDAEDPTNNPTAYSGTGITDAANGIFDPGVAGAGTHEIIFTYCGVDDTIWIDVTVCPSCESELDDVTPEICVGETYTLDPLVTNASAGGVWTIDSMPTGTAPTITTGTDTIFDASNLATTAGVYKLIYTVTDAGETCYDSVYITVNPLPTPDLGNDTSICVGDADVTFDAGSYASYLWSPGGETSQTITTGTAGQYIVTVTDANSCSANDTVVLTVNPLPTPDLGNDTSICAGDPDVTFDAGSYTSYLWAPGAETSQTITTGTAGEYIVTVTDANGCEANDTVNLTVNPLPTPDLGNDTAICAGDADVTFDAGSYTTYLWAPGGETSQTITTGTAGEYIVTVTDGNGCEANDTVNLTVNPLPTPDLGNDTSICVGDADVTFDAGSYTSYLWAPGGETSQTITTGTAGEYIVTVTDANGCEANDTVNLTVNPLPTPDLGNDTSICAGDPDVTFDAGSYTSYLWAPGAETSQTITTGTAGEYIVTVTDANGCEANDTVNLTVNPLPTPSLGADTAICEGDAAVIFDAGSYTSYLWAPGAETSQTISTDVDGEYIVTVTDGNGCEANDTVVLTVNPLPTPDLGNDTAICVGDADVTFDAGTYTSYLWSPGGETSQTITTGTAGEYIVTVTDGNGCEANDTVNLTVNPLPTPSLGADTAICEGDAAIIFDAGSYDTYAWQPGGETTQTISTDVDGEYIVTVTDANGCEANDTVILTVNPLPTPDLGNDTAICAGDPAVTFDAGTYSSYSWAPGAETTQTISTDVDGEYIVTVTDANGCEANDTVVLTVNPLPTPSLGADTAICIGDTDVTFDAGTYDSYAWQPGGETTQTITTGTAGEYIVTVTDVNGCEANDTVNLTVNPLPTPDLGNDSTICEGDGAVTFDAGSYDTYTWQPGGETTQTISTDVDGEYIVTVTDANGCEANDTVVLTVNPLPTPDLGNDTAICAGDPAVTFDAGSYSSYAWQPGGETTQTISTDVDGEYIVTVTDANGCESNDTVVLTVNPLPTPDLGNDQAICDGVTSVIFDAGSYDSYVWQPDGETTQTITTSTAGEYIVTVTDVNGCEANDTVNLLVNANPVVDLGPDSTICANEPPVVFDAGNFASYLWHDASTDSIISGSTSGDYIVVVTDVNGCTGTDTVNLTVNPLPTPDLGPDQEICDGGLGITFDAGTYNAYAWQPGGETSQTITVNTNGDYIVTVTDANGCEANDTVNLIVNPLPSVDLGNDVTICPGSQVTLDAGAGFATYMWNDASMAQTIDVNDANAGEFSVTVIDTNGCPARDTVEVVVAAELSVDLGPDTAFCDGNTLTVDAGGVLGGTYVWAPGGESTQTIDVTTSGTYSVEITDPMGCSGRDTIVVTVNPNPTVDLGPDVTICPGFDSSFTAGTGWASILWNEGSTTESITVSTAGTYYVDVVDANGCTATDTAVFDYFAAADVDLGSDITICPGTNANFDAGTFASYTWHDASGSQTYTGNSAETVYVDVVDANGCTDSDTAEIIMATSLPVDLGNDTAVCEGESVTINSGYPATGYTFTWNTGETTPTITVSTAGEYGVVVEDITGCSGSDSMILTINPLPVVDLGPDKEVCEGDSDGFDAGAGWSSVLWSTTETTQAITVDQDADYIVTVVDANGCEDTDTVHLTVNALPVVDLGNDQTVCPGSMAQFNAGSFTSYVWHDASTVDTYSSTTEEQVYVTVTDANGCVGSDTAEIYVRTALLVDLGPDQEACEGNTIDIISGYPAGLNTFSWNTGETTDQITVLTTGTYSVEVTDANGCTGNDTIEVTIHTNPTVDLGPDQSICDGDDFTFDAGATWTAVEWNDLSTGNTLTVATTGTYSVTVTDANGCIGTDAVDLTVNANPTVDLGPDVEVCPGNNVTFTTTPNGFVSYTWHDGSTGATYSTINPEVVYVDVVDVNGCTATDTAELTNLPALAVDLPADQVMCEGETYEITVPGFDPATHTFLWSNGSNQPTITVGITGTYNVFVSNGGGCAGFDTIRIDVNPNPTPTVRDTGICEGGIATFDAGTYTTYLWSSGESTQSISTSIAGTYSVTVTDANGCTGSGSGDLTVHSKPNIPAYADQEACAGQPITLNPTLPTGTYEWRPNGETSSSIVVGTAGDYTVVVTNANGCVDSITVNATFNALPVVDLGDDREICEGESATIGYPSGTNTLAWNIGVVSDELTVDSSGTFIATITDAKGCQGKDTISVTVNPLPVFTMTRDTTVCFLEIETLELTVSAGNRDQVQWSTGETTTDILVSEKGKYTVTVTTEAGCSSSGEVKIKRKCKSTFYVPNAFTPNNDGSNDYFGPVGLNIYDFDFYVFDRWGEEIFHSTDMNDKWDGTYKGRECQIDVYVWKAYYRTEEDYGGLKRQQKVGTVTILK